MVILIDTPPILPLADFEPISAACDGVMIVVRARHADREVLQKTASVLDRKKLLGVVLNGSQQPYRSAARVFWIIDNCSTHRGQKCVQRLQARWPSILPVHTPIHASWLRSTSPSFNAKFSRPTISTPCQNWKRLCSLSRSAMKNPPLRSNWTFTREKLAKLIIRLSVKSQADAA
jgi:hypothetical protein